MPAAFIPVIAGAAAGVGSALVVSTATAIAIGSAVMSATMMLTMKKPSLGDYRSASERSQVLRAAASDKSCVYGRVISSGLMSFAAEEAGEQDEGEWLHLALVLAGTKLTRIGDIWLGDDLVGTYGDLVSWELHADRQTCDPYMLEKCADWKEDMIGQGITWLRLSLKFNAEKFPAGLPNIKVEKFGKEVWDPRDNQWKWSDNPALVILDYYRSWLQVPDDEIRIEEFIVAANICDEIVTVADGKVEPRYTINAEFDLTEPRAKVLEALHMACCGQPTYIGGKFGILAGAYYGPASDELRPHQLVGDLELLPEPSSSDKINQVAGTFVDPITFKKTDFPAVIVPEWVEEDGGYPLLEDLDLRFVTSEHQAQRIANIILRQRRAARTITCSVNLSGWRYRPGQTIRFYLPAFGINGPEFRVTDWAFSLNGGVDLTLREDSPLFWADAIGKPMERPEITELPTGGVAMPDQLRYDVETVGEVVQGVLTWRNSGTVNYNQVIVQRIEPGKAPVTVLTAQVPGQSCRVNGLAAGNYTAMVRALALTGAVSPVAAVNFVISAPATPIGVEVEAGNWTLAFRPKFAGGDGYGVLCEWWVSTINLPIGEVMEKARAAGMGTYMQFGQLKPDTTYYVWLRAVNAYGKSALLAASGKTTYDASSILDIIDGEIGAEHLREELRKPIELIPGISEELTDLDKVVQEIKPIADMVPELNSKMVGLGDALAALDDRSQQTEDLLRDEQANLGEMGINNALQQDKIHSKIDRVQSEMGDLRDALFTVDPETGHIEMDAVRALRDETHASFTQVNQTLDAVKGTIATKADHTVVDAQGERLTEAEQVLDGINARLAQTVTKSEFTDEQERLTEVSNSLDATKGELAQKAAQSTVTAQGERLAAAEQKITANSDATSALAQSVEGLKAEVAQGDELLTATITEVARVSAEADKVTAERVSGLETRTDTAEGKIQALERIVEDDGGITAGRFDEITAALDLTAAAAEQAGLAGINNALAGEGSEQRARQAKASIRRDQKVQLDMHQALASDVTELKASFEGEQANTSANFTSVREVIAGVEQATAQQLSQIKTEFEEGDRKTSAAITDLSKVVSDNQQASAEALEQLEVKTDQTNAALAESNKVHSSATQANAEKIDQVQAVVDDTSAAVKTVASAVADLEGDVEAGWYTKAQINGEGGGFGLSVKLNPDGSVLTSFLLDADVFAVMSRATGVSSKVHPLVVKNGSVYMNHALMDTAEIGNVIAKYINVQHLKGTLIEGGSFRGGDLWLGENANGQFSAYGKRWNAGIDSLGRFYGSDVYFTSGTFQGNVLANSGTMNNVTIRENCQVLGSIYADRIVGDVAAVKSLYAPTPSVSNFSIEFVVLPSPLVRTVVISGITLMARGSGESGVNYSSARFYVNGEFINSQGVSARGMHDTNKFSAGATHVLPANTRGTYRIDISQYYGGVTDGADLSAAIAIVTKSASATFG